MLAHALDSLALCRALGGLPEHVGLLTRRADVRLRIAVTVQAPGHGKGLVHLNDFHGVDATVTGGAADAGRDVRLVGEVSVVRELVHADPGNRLPRLVGVTDRRELGAVLFDLNVTVHAGLRGRNRRVVRALDRVVAIATVQAEFSGVKLVAKGHGLLGAVADVRKFGRKPMPHHTDHNGQHQRDGGNDGEGDFIGPARKNSRHCSVHLS